MPSQNFIIGNKTQFYFSILPDSLLDAPVAPTDVTITVATTPANGTVAIGAVSLPVVALSGPVPAFTPIPLTIGTNTVYVFTTASAKTGDISLAIEATTVAIPDDTVGLYKGMLLLVGGTTSDEQVQSQDTEITVYGDNLGFSTGLITKASWMISYSFNVLPSDPGYYRLAQAAVNAVAGARAYVRKVDPAPSGYTRGESIEGVCDVTDFSKSNPADGIVSGKCSFKGRGAPLIKHYS